MEFFKFVLKENDPSNPDADVVEHEIAVLKVIAPETYGMIFKHLMNDDIIEIGKLLIEQYMWTEAGKNAEAVALQSRIMSDGRLLMSCATAMAPLYGIAEFELKKN